MTKTQELLGKILKQRIENETTKGTLNVEEMQNTLDILYAGGKITDEQYVEFTTLITPVEESSDSEEAEETETE